MWFYTNDKGKVARIDNIPYFQIINKFCEGAFDKELVAVLKKVYFLILSLLMVMVARVEIKLRL